MLILYTIILVAIIATTPYLIAAIFYLGDVLWRYCIKPIINRGDE